MLRRGVASSKKNEGAEATPSYGAKPVKPNCCFLFYSMQTFAKSKGCAMHLNHAKGRQGEFLASFILEQHGIEVHHVNRNGADLWCKLPSGKIVPIEVKTAARPVLDNSKHTRRYHFNTPRRDDIDAWFYCFVAMDKGLLWLRPTVEITMGTLSVREIEFTPELQADSVAALLAH